MNPADLVTSAFLIKLESVDFSMIRTKLMHTTHGSGWSKSKTLHAESEYKDFLLLQHLLPDASPPIVPTKLADDFWHQHILDTRKYQQDCELLFDRFLHHYPYFGLRDDADEVALTAAAKITRSRWKSLIGGEVSGFASCSGGGNCSSCKSIKFDLGTNIHSKTQCTPLLT
jgi:hypothetical protein